MIVNDGTIISSPLLKSNDFTATSSAVVPFVNATAYLRSNVRAKELSNLKTSSLLPDILDLLREDRTDNLSLVDSLGSKNFYHKI